MTYAMSLPRHLEVRRDEPLSRHSTFGVGGPADLWIEVSTVADLVMTLDTAREAGVPRTVIGHGTNLLVADAGIDGLVIANSCKDLKFYPDERLAHVESGHTMAQLARRAAKCGHAGLGFAIGVPGTVGGAVYGNAGAWGSDIAGVLVQASIWYPGGIHQVQSKTLNFGYRESSLQHDALAPVVLSATLRIQQGDPDELDAELKTFSRRRANTQPRGQTAGSFFKNPEGAYAGHLIESAGCKGCTYGGAFISPMHANFIANDGSAVASDILELALLVQRAVHVQFGVRLEPEVRVIGRWPATAGQLVA